MSASFIDFDLMRTTAPVLARPDRHRNTPLEGPQITGHLTYIPTSWYVLKCWALGTDPEPNIVRSKGTRTLNTLLITTQIVCYGVGIVSASLNIATFVRRRGKWQRLRTRHPIADQLVATTIARKGD
jgi:hypothetical protein